MLPMRDFVRLLSAVLFIPLTCLFCARAEHPSRQNEAALLGYKHAEILRLVPLGTPIPEAKARMESTNYVCSQQINQAWSTRSHLNYLWCNRSESTGWPVKRRWQVALVDENQKVSEVLISTGLIGP